jgi:hypothetical protein
MRFDQLAFIPDPKASLADDLQRSHANPFQRGISDGYKKIGNSMAFPGIWLTPGATVSLQG